MLSFFWVGLGQLYAGEIGRGIGMMIAWPFCVGIGLLGLFWTFAAGAGFIMALSAGEIDAIFGFLIALILSLMAVGAPTAFWIWGMIDAKKLCERWNGQR